MTPTHLIISLLLLLSPLSGSAFGSMGPIAASFGSLGFFCAIDASGKQQIICWQNSKSTAPASPENPPPPLAALSGGQNFLCGILSNTSQAYCWDSFGTRVVPPPPFETTSYTYVAAGKSHVCAIRGVYYSIPQSGLVDCWEIVSENDNKLVSKQSTLFFDPNISNIPFTKIVSGDDFTCGGAENGGIVCWGPKSAQFGKINENVTNLASGLASLCGVLEGSGEVKCWGSGESMTWHPPTGSRFVSLTAGADHFCGIRQDSHEVACWGRANSSTVPKGSGFSAIASSDSITCGIRETDLVLDCWFESESESESESEPGSEAAGYDPPLQLCSPGLCAAGLCKENEYSFNASRLNEPALTSLCLKKNLRICSPCGQTCPQGFFISSPCGSDSDRICTVCSLCQNSSCSGVCNLGSSLNSKPDQMRKLVLILGSSISGFLLFLIGCCLLNYAGVTKTKDCIGKKEETEKDRKDDVDTEATISTCPGVAQVFRLSELKDATNGFKEFNELGRGSYGFVYKALLTDGRQVAVKRANAATIIHSNTREFEMELEILCNVRHNNIVNLLGYCSEMGERLLVYEYMPHGTLHDHLHGGLSPLSWHHRLKIATQAAKGLEYLHNEVVPPIVHRDVKSSNILLDFDLCAKIADFGLLGSSEKDCNKEMRDDVYSFGVVLLEILSGRKGYDSHCAPPSIVEWAVPLIRKGKGAALIDRYVALPRNVEPLLRLAELAEVIVRENPSERPNIADVAASLEQLAREGLIL